jgi:hypothetical protein
MIAQELLFFNRLFKWSDLLGIRSFEDGGFDRAVIGTKGEERSLGSLAGLEAQPLHKAKPRQNATFGLGALKRRPYNDAHNDEAKASEPASENDATGIVQLRDGLSHKRTVASSETGR